MIQLFKEQKPLGYRKQYKNPKKSRDKLSLTKKQGGKENAN